MSVKEVRRMESKPGYWAVIPAQVRYDANIPPSAKLLYAEISSLTDVRGYCYASNAYFESLYNLSERTISRLIRTLADAGYINIADADGGKTQRKLYAGINPLGGDKNVYTPQTKMSIPPDKNVGGIKKDTKKEDQVPPKPPEGESASGNAECRMQNAELKPRRRRGEARTAPDWEPEMFQRLWALYPRGEDKQAAMDEWDRLHADRELMQIMSAALKRQIASEEWRRGVGIPYLCRWLKNRRWEDDAGRDGGSRAPALRDGEEREEWT